MRMRAEISVFVTADKVEQHLSSLHGLHLALRMQAAGRADDCHYHLSLPGVDCPLCNSKVLGK